MRLVVTAVAGLFLVLLPARPAEGQWREAGPSAVPPAPVFEGPAMPPTLAADQPFVGYAVLGAAAGAAAGTLVGGLLGGAVTSSGCETGNPDACFGEAFPGLLFGAGLGYAVGAPLGAHLGNGRRGTLGTSLLVSTALFGVQAVTMGLIGEHAYSKVERAALPVVFVAIPAAQLVSAVALERRSAARRQ